MPEPTVTELGRMVYEALAPLAKSDAGLGWPLLTYSDALVAQAQPVRDQARDRGAKEPGWSILFNLPQCPSYALDYLSQFAGADLTKLKRGIKVLLRNEFKNPSFEYDAAGSKAPFGWKSDNSASLTEEVFEVDEVWAAKGVKSLHIKAKKDNSVTRRRVGFNTGVPSSNYIPVSPGQHLTLQAQLNILHAAGAGFEFSLTWFKADGSTILSTSFGEAVLVGATGLQSIQQSFIAPEHAAFAEVVLGGYSETAEQVIEYRVDALMALVSASAPVGTIEYVDGDQKEGAWVGIPGQSASVKYTEQSEEEFNEAKRFRIKELKAAHRGMPSAIIAAAKQYLIGDQTVIMQERPGGNPWRLAVITYSEETPNEQLVREAIEEQMPAGIVLEYKTVPGADWLVIRTEYTTWQQVKEAFATWGGVRVNKPGE